MLDAAALVPCTPISLSDIGADAMCVSFYKMFGYPTGLGALVVKKSVLMDVLQRPWFGGGTVDLVQTPNTMIKRALVPNERFEVSDTRSLPSVIELTPFCTIVGWDWKLRIDESYHQWLEVLSRISTIPVSPDFLHNALHVDNCPHNSS